MRIKLIIIYILFLSSSSLFAYGANKVQYKRFKWNIIKTAHFDIYYNKKKLVSYDELGRRTSLIAEAAARNISKRLNYELHSIIPIIIYNSHNDFEQTNVTFGMIGEGVGGFTEFFQKRVVVPFSGSYADYRHVLHHEITHAYQFSLLYGNFWESLFTRPFINVMPPLWLMEGMAEYQSRFGHDSEMEMVIRDATINNMLADLRELENFSTMKPYHGFLVYKEGQAALNYIAEKYGEEKIGMILKYFKLGSRDIDDALNRVLDIDIEKLSEDFGRYTRKKYWSKYKNLNDPSEIGNLLTKHFQDGSMFNLKPVFYDNDKKIIFLTDRNTYVDIVMISSGKGKSSRTLIKGEREQSFEEMNSRENYLSITSNQKYMVFISKGGRYDYFYIYNLKKRKVINKFTPELDSIISPSVSCDGEKIAFAGVNDGACDIYTIDFNGKNLKRHTDDLFYESSLSWSRDNKYLYFNSNRGDDIFSPDYKIFRMDVESGEIVKIIDFAGKSVNPQISPDNKKMAFISDKYGTPDLFIKDLESGNIHRITRLVGGIFSPSWSSDGKKIVASVYNRLGYDILTMDIKPLEEYEIVVTNIVETNIITFHNEEELEKSIGLYDTKIVDRKMKLLPNWINGWIGFASGFGFAGSLESWFSDVLGDHNLYFMTDVLTGSKNFNINLEYFYLGMRWNFGTSIFHYYNMYYYYYNPESFYSYNSFFQRQYGIAGYISYPFSKFARLDFNTTYKRYHRESGRDYFSGRDFAELKANVYLFELNYVYSSTLMGITGPRSGIKAIFSIAQTVPIGGNAPANTNPTFDYGRYVYSTNTVGTNIVISSNHPIIGYHYTTSGKSINYGRALFEIRKYIRIFKRSTLAIRFLNGFTWGFHKNENTFIIGDYFTVRGVPYSDIQTGIFATLFNFEYRFPLFDNIDFAWPFRFRITNVRAVFFYDFGRAWGDYYDDITEWNKQTPLLSGFGVGIRMWVAMFLLKLDWATKIRNHNKHLMKEWNFYFSIGYDF